MDAPLWRAVPRFPPPHLPQATEAAETRHSGDKVIMAKIAKTADRKKIMDTSKSTDCPKCGKPTRIVKRVKDRERNVPGGIFISCSGCEFHEKL
jgi:DNA-directed RNA polymerase subunit M/transcription elongation factor TFIIS